MKVAVRAFAVALFLVGFGAFANDPRCIKKEIWHNGEGACVSCGHTPPEGAYQSLYAYRNRFSFLCESCTNFCSTIPQRPDPTVAVVEPVRCASPSEAPFLPDALLFGIDVEAATAEILRLAEESPELALFLMTFDIVDGAAPAVDQKRHHALASSFPSDEVVRAALQGQPEELLSKYPSESLPPGTSLFLESRAVLLPNQQARLHLTSQLVTSADRVVLETLREVTVELRLANSKKLKVQYRDALEADAYEISSIVIE